MEDWIQGNNFKASDAKVTRKWCMHHTCVMAREKTVLDRVGDCWSYFIPFSSTLTERLIWKVIIITLLLSLLIVSFPWDCLKFVMSVVSFRCNVWSWFWNWIQLKQYCSLRLLYITGLVSWYGVNWASFWWFVIFITKEKEVTSSHVRSVRTYTCVQVSLRFCNSLCRCETLQTNDWVKLFKR